MSAELVLGLLVGVAGLVVAVAIPLWQLLSGEQRKKSLPPKIDITYFALRMLIAAKVDPSAKNTALAYEELYKRIVEDCNDSTPDGNFDPNRKNKKLRSYIDDSIERLRSPEARDLGALIETVDGAYVVTALGQEIFGRLPSEPSERPESLSELLKGSHDLRERKPSEATDETSDRSTADRAPQRPRTAREWRHAVFMAMPDDGAHEFDDLKQMIGKELSLSSLMTQAHKTVGKAICWNLKDGNLTRDDDGRIRRSVHKDSKTAADFK